MEPHSRINDPRPILEMRGRANKTSTAKKALGAFEGERKCMYVQYHTTISRFSGIDSRSCLVETAILSH